MIITQLDKVENTDLDLIRREAVEEAFGMDTVIGDMEVVIKEKDGGTKDQASKSWKLGKLVKNFL